MRITKYSSRQRDCSKPHRHSSKISEVHLVQGIRFPKQLAQRQHWVSPAFYIAHYICCDSVTSMKHRSFNSPSFWNFVTPHTILLPSSIITQVSFVSSCKMFRHRKCQLMSWLYTVHIVLPLPCHARAGFLHAFLVKTAKDELSSSTALLFSCNFYFFCWQCILFSHVLRLKFTFWNESVEIKKMLKYCIHCLSWMIPH